MNLKTYWHSLLAISLILCAGCKEHSRYQFLSASGSNLHPQREKFEIQVPGEKPVAVYLSCSGTRKKVEGIVDQKVAVEFQAKNLSSKTLTLYLSETVLVDDESRRYSSPVIATAKKVFVPNAPVIIAPKAKGTWVVEFKLPEDVKASRIGSIRCLWDYESSDGKRSVDSKFLRSDIGESKSGLQIGFGIGFHRRL